MCIECTTMMKTTAEERKSHGRKGRKEEGIRVYISWGIYIPNKLRYNYYFHYSYNQYNLQLHY
jgi:hypothetical protein